jgi:gliding motility-associated-like protein
MLRVLRYHLFLIFLGIAFSGSATHNRAGEITYKCNGNTYTITLVTYTADGDNIADRCQDTIYFGDGTSAVVPRSNGPLGTTDCGNNTHLGEILAPNFKKNVFVVIHTYPGPGCFTIKMFDRNRNSGVINIPNSVNQPFYLESMICTNAFGGCNNSVQLTVPPLDKACYPGQCFYHNPGAFDPDGDSLSYEITTCKGEDINGNIGVTIPGYTFPNTGSGSNATFNINATTGLLTWCSPQLAGEYNVAFLVKEWRKNFDGDYYLIGYVMRDMQITVAPCINNPPQITAVVDTCVTAGDFMKKRFVATDADALNVLTMTATGGPFAANTPTATFASAPTQSLVTGLFQWQTSCTHIRKSPYQVTIKVIDNNSSVALVDFKTYNITVVAPPPKNLSAFPIGTSVKLQWNRTKCNNTFVGNNILYYTIYRKLDCNPWVHGPCETGVPASSGFTYIGHTTSATDTTYTDSNGGNGLTHGVDYSYLVVAVYNEGSVGAVGAQSYASNQVCVRLKRDIPILTNVDVTQTGGSNGQVFVRWVKPVPNVSNLDTTILTGPYEFRLFYKKGQSGTYAQVYSVTKPAFYLLNQLSDTTFMHSSMDSQTDLAFYRLDFYSNNQFVGSAQNASSVFLSAVPADRKITLSWKHFVPWNNYKYFIYRKSPSQTVYSLIDSTTALTYTDLNLANRATYCYKILSKGQYSDPTILRPLLNNSQEVCAAPIDQTKPCIPTLNITSDCVTGFVQLQWNNPNHSCADDVIKYFLYSKPTEGDDLVRFDSIYNVNDTTYTFDGLKSIAGCYLVTAVDSSGNESNFAEAQCVDNCPEFELPNIVTANGDGVNDFFKAIKVRYIKDIELKVYDRWGLLLYETTDPYFNWDCKVPYTKMMASEGTYFYTCKVNEIRVAGIKPRLLKGWVQIFNK